MKSLFKSILNSDTVIFLRNNFGFKAKHRNIKNNYAKTISDAFCWRTDNNYKTYFRFNDILMNFFDIENSFIVIKFYSRNSKFLKEIKIEKLANYNEIIIDKDFFGGLEDYGTFYIFHHTKNLRQNSLVSNRCYVGYSVQNGLPSFMHGNTPVKFKKIDNEHSTEMYIVKSSIFCKNKYKIQKNFDGIEYTELFFSNPMSKKLKLNIFNKSYILLSGESKLIKFKDINQISFVSNCMFLRPAIFSYNNNCIDVHHS
tara:strand:+ start:620 stop:1387 length:768 start_codon:yes stop_codon:yes gene_type:complete